MRAIVTGQVGLDKKEYLQRVVDLAGSRGESIALYNVGDMMYAEARDVGPGRILDLQLSRLQSLRRSAFKDIIRDAQSKPNIIVNTHATFRWRHGLFSAFDFDHIRAIKPDLLICMVDNIETTHARLHREHVVDATLKDLMVWREEEIMATEIMAQALGIESRFYVVSRGRHQDSVETTYRLICRSEMRKVYPSFPMTHVARLPQVLEGIDDFRSQLAKRFIAFDPGDVDEKILLDRAIDATKRGEDFVEVEAGPFFGGRETLRVSAKQVLDVAGDIDGQIYARDFKMVRQSDMIVSLVPALPDGTPGLSSGVERELHHAFEHGREVYIVWHPRKNPSPFITETSTKWFRSVEEAMAHFEAAGMFHHANLFGH